MKKLFSAQQATALANPCLLGEETVHPIFRKIVPGASINVTINTGYE
jgi:hypothetical protein